MAFITKTYDADAISIYFNGVLAGEGLADGEFLTIENMSDAFTSVVGTDGEVARSRSNDRRAKITLKLLQTSAINAALSALHNIDLNSPNGSGIGTISIVDAFGATKYQGANAWIVKWPDVSLDRTAKSREWILECANLDRFEGGK